MALRVGINGFGRIGRQVARAWLMRHSDDFELVAVNDLTDTRTLTHLLRYDTVYGRFPGKVDLKGESLALSGKEMALFAEPDPAAIPWGRAGVEVVIEATGLFTRAEDAGKHLRDGVKKVVISTNGRGEDLTLVYGVNSDAYDPAAHHIISAGSCTTNCVVPMADVLHREFGIRSGFLTTVHAYTASQNLVDAKSRSLRRARAAAENVVPTTSGATAAIGKMFPELEGKIGGLALRVPLPAVSISDLVTELERPPSRPEAINEAFAEAANGRFSEILEYEEEELVSSDFTQHPASAIFDSPLTEVSGSLAKTLAWYDNEWGYACRLTDICALLGERGFS